MKNTVRNLLEESMQLIEKLSVEEFSMPLELLNGNSIGKHFRHILDLFECLVQANYNSVLNYDQRKRNPELETSIELTREKLNFLLEEIDKLNLDKEIEMNQRLGTTLVKIKSLVQRELLYNIEHTIHHLAIIRIGIEQNFPQLEFPVNFGVAFSTIQYRESCEA